VSETSLLKKTRECFKEELTAEELHKKWFFDKVKGWKNYQAPSSIGGGGRGRDKTKVLEKVWEWAKEAIPHFKNKLFLDQDRDGRTAWHVTAKFCKTEVWKKLWYWDKEALT
jgi:hypothetical protein